jgi:hypothetical protein
MALVPDITNGATHGPTRLFISSRSAVVASTWLAAGTTRRVAGSWSRRETWSGTRMACIFGVPIAALELAGKAASQGLAWYVIVTAVVGLIQFGHRPGAACRYRKSGILGEH